MTAPRSTGNSRFVTYYLYRLSQMKSRFTAMCLMSLFSFPLLAVCVDVFYEIEFERKRGAVSPETNAQLQARLDMMGLTAGIGVFAALVLVFIIFLQGHFTAKESFRYYSYKKYSDMDMSLPLDHNTRFFGDMLAGLSVYLVPQVIAVILAELILLPGYGIAESIKQLSLDPPNYVTGMKGSFDLVQVGIVYAFIANIMQYFFVMMLLSFCGRSATANMVPFIFGIGLPVAATMLNIISGAGCYGVGLGEFAYSQLLDCSPLGTVCILFLKPTSELWSRLLGLQEIKVLLCSAAYGIAAYFMMKYRRAERTGSTFAYRGGRYATEFMIMLASATVVYFSAMHIYNNSNSIGGTFSVIYRLLEIPTGALVTAWIVINLIVFVIIELVSREKLKKPVKLILSAARFAAGAGLSFLICFLYASSDGFGAASYIPEMSEIESVNYTSYMPDMYYIDHNATITDEQGIKLITDMHRRIVAERPDMSYIYDISHNPSNGNYAYEQMSIYYIMKDGSLVQRSYYLPSDYARDVISLWFECGAFARTYDMMPEKRANDKAEVQLQMYDTRTKNYYTGVTEIPYEELADAIKRDAAKTTYEDIFLHEGADFINAILYDGIRMYNVNIWDTFEESIAVIRKYNYETFENRLAGAVGYYMYKATSAGDWTPEFVWERGFDQYGYPYEIRDFGYHEISEEDAKELIAHSSVKTVYETSRDVYVVVPLYEFTDGEGNWYRELGWQSRVSYVLEEYCDEAAKIYESSRALSDEEQNALLNNGY